MSQSDTPAVSRGRPNHRVAPLGAGGKKGTDPSESLQVVIGGQTLDCLEGEHMEENRIGRVAYIRYEGGILGERHVDKHLDEPLAVRIGAGRVVKGVIDALRTMEVGDSATLIIPPEEGYGDADPKQIKWYPRSIIPHGYEIKKDTMIMWESADGLAKRPAMVVDATEDTVKIDMNHPYAGKTLEYWVELVDLQ